MRLEDYPMWAYRAVFKQTDAGGGNIVVIINPTGRFRLLYGTIGPDDYAAARTISSYIDDGSDHLVARLIESGTSINNVTIPLISDASLSGGEANQIQKTVEMSGIDLLKISANSLAQNEELTISIRALIERGIPTIDISDSGGTVTITETYNKVI